MESILELKPILLRMFGEVESLQASVRERDERIRHLESAIEKLTKENEIYHKVVRMYEGISDDSQHAEQEQPEHEDEAELPIPLRPEVPIVQLPQSEPPKQTDEKKVTVKQRRRKVRVEPEPQPQPQVDKAEKIREYQRQYRQKRKEAKK